MNHQNKGLDCPQSPLKTLSPDVVSIFHELETSSDLLANATEFVTCVAVFEDENGRINSEAWSAILELINKEASANRTLIYKLWDALKAEPETAGNKKAHD